ncbi:MAG: ABC transporter permease [Rickettsiaceae bacterium]
MKITKNPPPIVIVRRVIYAIFLKELKTRFGDYKLGIFWIFLDPVIQVAFFVVFFGYVIGRVMPNVDYTVYVTTGILTWLMFKNVLNHGITAIKSDKSLFIFRQVKPFDVFISKVFLELFIFSIVYVISILTLIYLGREFIFFKPLEFIICYICIFLIGCGLSLLIMFISDLYRDIRKIVGVVLRVLYFTSGVIFPIKLIPEKYHYLLSWNPIVHVMELSREAVFPAFKGTIGSLLYILISTIIIVFLGLLSFYLTKKKLLQ